MVFRRQKYSQAGAISLSEYAKDANRSMGREKFANDFLEWGRLSAKTFERKNVWEWEHLDARSIEQESKKTKVNTYIIIIS